MRRRYLRTKLVKAPKPPTAKKVVKAPSRELVKAPPRRPIRTTQATQRRVLIGVVHATWTTTTGRLDEAGHRRWQHGLNLSVVETQVSFDGPMAPGDSKEGLNKRGARNLTNIFNIYGGGIGGITGPSDEDSTVRDTG